jgi:hypothetical protein
LGESGLVDSKLRGKAIERAVIWGNWEWGVMLFGVSDIGGSSLSMACRPDRWVTVESDTIEIKGKGVSGFWGDKPVVCEHYTGWEVRIGWGVHQVVGHVDKIGPRRVDLLDSIEGLGHGEVGRVRAMAEGIEDEGIAGFEQIEGAFGDLGDIGAVGQGQEVRSGAGHLKDEPEDGEFAVVEGDRGDVQSEEGEWDEGLDEVGYELGDEGFLDVLVGLEDVLIDALEGVHSVSIGVDVDGGAHDLVEPSDLVEPEGVIDMVVCIEDGIDAGDALAEDLLAEVGRGVDEDDAVDPIRVGELDG